MVSYWCVFAYRHDKNKRMLPPTGGMDVLPDAIRYKPQTYHHRVMCDWRFKCFTFTFNRCHYFLLRSHCDVCILGEVRGQKILVPRKAQDVTLKMCCIQFLLNAPPYKKKRFMHRKSFSYTLYCCWDVRIVSGLKC